MRLDGLGEGKGNEGVEVEVSEERFGGHWEGLDGGWSRLTSSPDGLSGDACPTGMAARQMRELFGQFQSSIAKAVPCKCTAAAANGSGSENSYGSTINLAQKRCGFFARQFDDAVLIIIVLFSGPRKQ